MKCIILCAGHGSDEESNLKALTIVKDNTTALDLLINNVNRIDEIDNIYIVTNGKNYNEFLDWSKKNKDSKVEIINDNTTSPNAKLGAIGDIKFTLNTKNINDDLLIVAGDAIYDFNFDDIYRYYKEKKTAVVAVKRVDTPLEMKKSGLIIFDDNNLVTEMKEKVQEPIGTHMALALYFYPKETIRLFDFYLSEGNQRTYPGFFLEYLYTNMDVYAYEISGNYSIIE